jgi:multimeric flavodoxin WrbA
MKITILNGNPQDSAFDAYINQTQTLLEAKGNQITHILLRDLLLKYCTGCWGCWVKTPGKCQSDPASQKMDEAVINTDFVLWASPMKMGYPSELLKMAMDKHLPLIHPYMVVDQFEAHHQKRYVNYPRLGLLIEKEPSSDELDLQIVTQLFQRTALNFKSRLYFSLTTENPASELVEKIMDPSAKPLKMPATPLPTKGVMVKAPENITLFNGSPRGPHGNSPIFLQKLAEGFGGESKMIHLVNTHATAEHVQAFRETKAVWLAFPLYTDSMPGIVKHFIEALEPLVGQNENPPIGFIVQSGFPEGLHSRFVERYLEKLAARLGSPYLGTIIKGNGEGVRIMPDKMNQTLFEGLQSLGRNLANGESLNPSTLTTIAKPESFPKILAPVFQLFVHLPIAHGYFDDMLKKNNVYEQRFDRPFAKTANEN